MRLALVIILLLTLNTAHAASGKIVGIRDLQIVSRLTGTPSLNNTKTPYDIGGTDLGIPVRYKNKTYFLFGDTFSGEDVATGGNWRRNVAAWTRDTILSDGITFDGFAVDKNTLRAKQIFTSNVPSDVVTNIPTGGIAVKGNMYAWFMNVTKWGPVGGEWYISQAELAKWNDRTKAFDLINNNVFAGNSNFGMVAVRDGVAGDPYIYLWGTSAGRFGKGVKLARFLPSKIETRSAYQFYNGKLKGIPQWISDEYTSNFVLNGSIGEMSVIFNHALSAWTMMYFNQIDNRIEIRQSDNPWGTWSEPIKVMTPAQIPKDTVGIYAPYMLPQWVEDKGRTIYFTLSLWVPYDVYLARATLDIEPADARP